MTDERPVVWMTCPYPNEICTEPATWEFQAISAVDDSVEGIAVCANGHRWRITKMQDNP